jgi:homoserine dehydrogenase
LAGAHIEQIEALLNGTTQGILRMMEARTSYADALAEMQRYGLAEAGRLSSLISPLKGSRD